MEVLSASYLLTVFDATKQPNTQRFLNYGGINHSQVSDSRSLYTSGKENPEKRNLH